MQILNFQISYNCCAYFSLIVDATYLFLNSIFVAFKIVVSIYDFLVTFCFLFTCLVVTVTLIFTYILHLVTIQGYSYTFGIVITIHTVAFVVRYSYIILSIYRTFACFLYTYIFGRGYLQLKSNFERRWPTLHRYV